MAQPTHIARPPQSAPQEFRPGWRSPRARIAYNILRAVIGVAVLCVIPVAGPIALLGLLPLAWAAVGTWLLYRQQHRA